MIKANFKAYSTYVTDSLNQWDLNQVLQVTGLNLTAAPEVHFSNANTDRAIVRQATMENHVVNVTIPNSLLQDPLRIYAHIGVYEGKTFKVVEVVEIPVQPRKRPMDYQIEDSDEEVYSFKRLENLIGNAATKDQVANIVAGVGSDAELVDVRYGADGKTYASAGEAVREQVAIADGRAQDAAYQVGLHQGYAAKFTNDGSYLHTGGYMHDLPGAFSSDLIPCDNFGFLRYRTSLDSSGYEVGFYDEQKELIPEVSVLGDNFFVEKVIDLSDIDAAYVRVSGYENVSKNATKATSYCILYAGNSLPKFDESEKATKAFDTLFGELAALPVMFDKVGYFATGGGGKENLNTAGFCTEFVPCTGFNYLRYKTNIDSSAYEVCFYDADRVLMTSVSIQGDNIFTEKIVDISNFGASYVRLCGYTNADKNATAETCYAYLYNRDIGKELDQVVADQAKTKDKQLLIFGDSITETAYMNADGSGYTEGAVVNWPTFIPELLGTSNFKNFAKSGAHFADFNTDISRQKLSEQIALAVADPNLDPDIVVVSMGTNDGGQTDVDSYATAMGISTLAGLDKTKLYQAIRYALWTLRQTYPNAKGFIATPIQRADREPLAEISDAIKEMGRRYGFIVIDAESESGIIRENEVWQSSGTFLTDGLHPNAAGSRKIAELYCSIIKSRFI